MAVARYDRLTAGADGRGSSRLTVDTRSARPPGCGPDEAEVAFVVRDDHQGRGLGTVLLEHLNFRGGGNAGSSVLWRTSLPDNHRMLKVFRSAGFERARPSGSGVIRVTMGLSAQPSTSSGSKSADVDRRRALDRALLRPVHRRHPRRCRGLASVGHELVRQSSRGRFTAPSTGRSGRPATAAGIRRIRVSDIPARLIGAYRRAGGAAGQCRARMRRKGFGVWSSSVSDDPRPNGATRTARIAPWSSSPAEFRHAARGPPLMGVINTSPAIRMNASVAEHPPAAGRVAFSSQSGGLGIALLGELGGRGPRHLELRVPRQQGRRERQRPAPVLGAGPRDRRHPPLPRVVRESPANSAGSPVVSPTRHRSSRSKSARTLSGRPPAVRKGRWRSRTRPPMLSAAKPG